MISAYVARLYGDENANAVPGVTPRGRRAEGVAEKQGQSRRTPGESPASKGLCYRRELRSGPDRRYAPEYNRCTPEYNRCNAMAGVVGPRLDAHFALA
jgi:hypothetical protein